MTGQSLYENFLFCRDQMAARFSPEELASLCQNMGADPDNLPYRTKEQLATQLLQWADRRDKRTDLLALLRQDRPTVSWPADYTTIPNRATQGQQPTTPTLPPSDQLPEPGRLPPGSRLVFDRNPLFTGREAELLDLWGLLRPDRPAASAVIIATGIGGVGKTQMAVEFAYRYGQHFHGVHWLSLADSAVVPSEVVACAEVMGLPVVERPQDEVLAHVRRVWAGPEPRLIIFDNCEDAALLATWRPLAGGACVLVTSRRTVWPPEYAVATRSLAPLPRTESLKLIRAYLAPTPRRETDAALGRVADALGDLPLALALAGHYLARYRTQTVDAYLATLAAADELVPVGHGAMNLTGHELSVRRTFAVSYDRLRPAAGDDADEAAIKGAAIALLARAACFAPGEPIPGALLLASLAADPPTLADEARERLLELGLLEPTGADDESYRLHRLLARFVEEEFVRHGADGDEDTVEERQDAERMTAAQAAVEKAVERALTQANDSGDPRSLRGAETQLRHVVDRAAEREDESAASLCSTLDYYLGMAGDLRGALPFSRRALAIRERVLGPEHADTAGSLNNLGMLLRAQGDLARARPYLERALAIRESVLGPEHPDTAQSLNNLGYQLHTQGALATARLYFERALAIYERALSPEHLKTASSLNNLGTLLQAQGDLAGARPYYERALDIWERVLGPEHPNTAASLNNLAYLLQAQGNLVGAQPYFERALAICKRVLGPDHPTTATSLNNLGMLLQAQGDLAGARPYFEHALAVREHVLGLEHPDTAASFNNLGTLLRAQGDLVGARSHFERALAVSERVLGPEHPDLVKPLGNLALLNVQEGNYLPAERHLARAQRIARKTLGPRHSHTVAMSTMLAQVQQLKRLPPGARPRFMLGRVTEGGFFFDQPGTPKKKPKNKKRR